MNIGDKISRERKAKGLSQKELASLLNVSDKLISKWESGRATPSVDYIARLCTIFDKDFNYFLQKDNEELDKENLSGSKDSYPKFSKKKYPKDKVLKWTLIPLSIIFIIGILAISHFLLVPAVFNWQNLQLLNEYSENSFDGDFFDITLSAKSYKQGRETSSTTLIFQAKIEDGKASYYEYNEEDNKTIIYKDGIEYLKNSSSERKKLINLDGLSLQQIYSYYQLEENEDMIDFLALEDDNFIKNIRREGAIFYFDIDKKSFADIDNSILDADSINGKAIVVGRKLKTLEITIKYDSNKIVGTFDFNLTDSSFSINHVENIDSVSWTSVDKVNLSDLSSLLPGYTVNSIENTNGITDVVIGGEKIVYTTSPRFSQTTTDILTNIYVYDKATQKTQFISLDEWELEVGSAFCLANPHYCHLYKNYLALASYNSYPYNLCLYLINLDTLEVKELYTINSFYARDNYVITVNEYHNYARCLDLDSDSPEQYTKISINNDRTIMYIDKYFNCYFEDSEAFMPTTLYYTNIKSGQYGEIDGKEILLQCGDYIWVKYENSLLAYAYNGTLNRAYTLKYYYISSTNHVYYDERKDILGFDNVLVANASNPAKAQIIEVSGIPSSPYISLLYDGLILASSDSYANFANLIYYDQSLPPIYLREVDAFIKGYSHFVYNDKLYIINNSTIYEIYKN